MGPSGAGSPSITGNCEIRMWAEIPARKPTVTGTESRSATQPSRKIPAARRKSPTMSASAAASVRLSGEPAAARAARPPAKIGVIVESAPEDKKRLLPNAAKASEPAIKARKPICGANPPSRAVAICSGIAIAASVRPANKSWARNCARYPLREPNTGQALLVPAEFAEPEVFAIVRCLSLMDVRLSRAFDAGLRPRMVGLAAVPGRDASIPCLQLRYHDGSDPQIKAETKMVLRGRPACSGSSRQDRHDRKRIRPRRRHSRSRRVLVAA